MATIGVEKLGRALNLTRSRIAQLVHEGMPKEGRGQYDFLRCAHWYICYMHQLLAKRPPDGLPGEREERLRLLRADADLKEMELSRQRSQLVAVSDVDQAFAELATIVTSHIMAIPPRLAPELVGETSRVMVQAKIEKATRAALSQIAKEYRRGGREALKESAR